MELHELLDGVLAGKISPVSAPAEEDYHRLWLEHQVNTSPPFVTAALGGALADRLAWVFLAGYQATIRRCFPDLPPEDGWSAFVNTEDRSGSLPGTSLVERGDERYLSGFKTWVAAADHLDRMLVSASQGTTPFCLIRPQQAGVRIESDSAATYLPELVQGVVEFVDVVVSGDDLFGDERTFPIFRSSESAYVRTALFAFMLSHAVRLDAPPWLISDALAGLCSMDTILQLPSPSNTVAVAMLGADRYSQLIASDFEVLVERRDPPLYERWTRDARLVYGAGPTLAARAEAAFNAIRNT
jgi:hypothetical protein